MALTGIESFRKKFKEFSDCYTIIGGAACDILMTEADMHFRATKDIDMIILFEDRYRDFARVFWEFIKEGKYQCGWKSSKDIHFYRFTNPSSGYPVQIELFSRKPDYHLEVESGIIPIHIDDDVSSLSAILLNDDFYFFMMNGRRIIDQVSVLSAEYIIPFKMYAWLNLKDQKTKGQHVNHHDLTKHKYDVFRLLQIIPVGTRIPSSGLVQETVHSFLSMIEDEELNLQNADIALNKEEGIKLLRQIYAS